MTTPPVCSYENSDYQQSFWEQGGREYEDRCEAIALKHLLPPGGHLMLELGAGAGRNTPRYRGFERVVLLDYSRTQLEQAQQRLGSSERFIYVAADAYRLPFVDGLFDSATMIRTLHHMSAAPAALAQVKNVLQPGAVFILEFANKRNLKAIARFLLRRQEWDPFTPEPVEFAALNFDFHPRTVRAWVKELGFTLERTRTVSHFRMPLLKRLVPARFLAGLDALFQWTGDWFQLTPSVFLRLRVRDGSRAANGTFFKCPACGHAPLVESSLEVTCPACHRPWQKSGGIYDFREVKT